MAVTSLARFPLAPAYGTTACGLGNAEHVDGGIVHHSCQVQPDRAYYGVLGRFWQLGAGALLFQWHVCLADASAGAEARLGRPRTQALLLFGLGLIAVAVLICRPAQVPFPLGVVLVAGVLMVLHAIAYGAASGLMVARWLASPPGRCDEPGHQQPGED